MARQQKPQPYLSHSHAEMKTPVFYEWHAMSNPTQSIKERNYFETLLRSYTHVVVVVAF